MHAIDVQYTPLQGKLLSRKTGRWKIALSEIQFELRDISPDMVEAWQKYFAGMANVRISHGDIFDSRRMPSSVLRIALVTWMAASI